MAGENKGASLKWAAIALAVLFAVVSIPFGVAQLNDYLIGASEPCAEADNLITGTYTYNGGTTSSVSYIIDNGKISVSVPDENVDDGYKDTLQLEVNEPTVQTLVGSDIVEYYAEWETMENYENIATRVKFDDGSNTFQIHEETDQSGNNFSELTELTTDYIYKIQAETSENANPVLEIETPAGDNQNLANEVIEVKSWAYESTSVVHATHNTIWKISMMLMAITSFGLAIFATDRFDLEVNF